MNRELISHDGLNRDSELPTASSSQMVLFASLIASLNDLATRCTTTFSDMPRNPNRGGSRLEDCIIKILDLEDELKADIAKLVNLKKEIMEVIKAVPNVEYQTLLEKRYLCFITWEQIAVDMNYSMQHVHRMHSTALKEIVVPEKDES